MGVLAGFWLWRGVEEGEVDVGEGGVRWWSGRAESGTEHGTEDRAGCRVLGGRGSILWWLCGS